MGKCDLAMVTLEQLNLRLHYNPDNGIFTYIIPVAQMRPGDIAGRPNGNGHIQISINNRRYMAHNLAWLYMTGEMPDGFIVDHKNRVYDDNRWNNLRKANLSENCGNSKYYKNNTSGYKGVYFKKSAGKFVAQLTNGSKRIHLGYFDTAEAAHAVYSAAAINYFGKDFANV